VGAPSLDAGVVHPGPVAVGAGRQLGVGQREGVGVLPGVSDPGYNATRMSPRWLSPAPFAWFPALPTHRMRNCIRRAARLFLSTHRHKYNDVLLAEQLRFVMLGSFLKTMPRTSPYSIRLSSGERSELESQARRYTSPYYTVLRAKIVLMAAAGLSNDQIGARLSVPRQIVSKWRKRFFDQRTAGLEDEARSGRPPAFSP